MQVLAAGTLQPKLNRVSARGVLKNTHMGVNIYVGMIVATPLKVNVPASATRSSLELSEAPGDEVVPQPNGRQTRRGRGSL